MAFSSMERINKNLLLGQRSPWARRSEGATMIEIRETRLGRVLVGSIFVSLFALFFWSPDRSLGHWLGLAFFASVAAKWLWLISRGDVVLRATPDGVSSRDFQELGTVPWGAIHTIFASGAILYIVL